MIHSAVRSATAAARKRPQIQFLGKNRWSGKHALGPHPMAPLTVASHYKDFVLQQSDSQRRPGAMSPHSASSSSSSSKSNLPEEWDMPLSKTVAFQEGEQSMIASGGASAKWF